VDDKELKIEILDEVKDEIARDPEMAELMADFIAMLHQAHDAVRRGQYKTMDDALEALTGNRPVQIDPETGEEIPYASMHNDMGLDDE
jgi:ATP-dependent protease HslVU (ClpYQ) ATPase subunit